MRAEKRYQITEFCHRFVADYISEGDCCIDATCGNGYDTEFLCSRTGPTGKVYAFDIQREATERTGQRLARAGYAENALVLNTGHENMADYVKEKAAAIMFNFGYLPGGDHCLATKPETSLKAVEAGLKLLRKDGIMSLCIYSGGDTGYEEKEALLTYVKNLDPREWLVILCSYCNRRNDPPLPVFIIRLTEESGQNV